MSGDIFLGDEVPGEKIFEVGVGTAARQLGQGVREPGLGVHPACPACKGKAIDDRAGGGASHGIAEEPPLSSYDKIFDFSFNSVVVYRRPRVARVCASRLSPVSLLTTTGTVSPA